MRDSQRPHGVPFWGKELAAERGHRQLCAVQREEEMLGNKCVSYRDREPHCVPHDHLHPLPLLAAASLNRFLSPLFSPPRTHEPYWSL